MQAPTLPLDEVRAGFDPLAEVLTARDLAQWPKRIITLATGYCHALRQTLKLMQAGVVADLSGDMSPAEVTARFEPLARFLEGKVKAWTESVRMLEADPAVRPPASLLDAVRSLLADLTEFHDLLLAVLDKATAPPVEVIPGLTPAEAQQAIEDLEQGRGLTLEEAFARLRGE
jgi:hypothetical protein